jgi:hypothetical protein
MNRPVTRELERAGPEHDTLVDGNNSWKICYTIIFTYKKQNIVLKFFI